MTDGTTRDTRAGTPSAGKELVRGEEDGGSVRHVAACFPLLSYHVPLTAFILLLSSGFCEKDGKISHLVGEAGNFLLAGKSSAP